MHSNGKNGLASEWVQKLSVDSPTSGISTIDFRDVDPVVMGRLTHLMGITIQADVSLTTVAADMDEPMPGEMLWSLLQDLRLSVGSHEYFRGTMDGLDVLDCTRQRLDRDLTEPAVVPDADDTLTRTLSWYVPTSRPAAPMAYRYDYVLPVLGLRDCGDSRLNFGRATSCRGFEGVTASTTWANVSVWGHFAALDSLRETVWAWERHSSNAQYLQIHPAGGIEAVLWRPRIVSEGSVSSDLSNAANILVAVDGTPIGRAQSADDFATSLAMIRAGLAPISYVDSQGTTDKLDVISEPTRYSRTKLAQGDVRVTWTNRNNASERFLSMCTGDRADAGSVSPIRSAVGAPSGAGQSATITAAAGPKTPKHDGVLDGKLYFRGMPGAIARRKAARLPIAGPTR